MEKKKLTLKKETIAVLTGGWNGGSRIINTIDNCDNAATDSEIICGGSVVCDTYVQCDSSPYVSCGGGPCSGTCRWTNDGHDICN